MSDVVVNWGGGGVVKQFVILFCESCYRNKYLLTLLMYSYHLSLDINKQIDTDTILSLCIRKTQQKITIQTKKKPKQMCFSLFTS